MIITYVKTDLVGELRHASWRTDKTKGIYALFSNKGGGRAAFNKLNAIISPKNLMDANTMRNCSGITSILKVHRFVAYCCSW
jgi:hypothetical protein